MARVNIDRSSYISVPMADSEANSYIQDVIGNKTDTTSGDSLVSLVKSVGTDETIRHIPKFGGEIWFIDAGMASSGDGKSPDLAFKTIGEGITAMSDGDALTVKAGTYTETGLDLSNNYAEIWYEAGTILDPATGTGLIVSGNYCRIACNICGDANSSAMVITPGANETGVEVTGNGSFLNGIRVSCASTADIGFDITGNGPTLNYCRCSNPLIAAFKIQGDSAKLNHCITGGLVADTSIGFWVTNSCDKFRIRECSSQGHVSGGFQVDTGCTNGAIEYFSSGGGDGKWIDADDTTVISGLSYPETKYKLTTITTTGLQTYNLFRVYGSIQVNRIFGHVSTVISSNLTACHLQLWDGTTIDKITDDDGVFSALPVGTLLIKEDKSDKTISIGSSAAGVVLDEVDAKKEAFRVVQKTGGVATYIRFSSTSTDTPPSGAIHWHVMREPLTDDGFLEVA